MRYVALLRGINVGKANRVRMVDLIASLENRGILGSTTYLQSGNVIFDWSNSQNGAEQAIDRALSDLALRSTAILRTADQLAQVAASKAFEGREEPAKVQFVTYFREPFDADPAPGEASVILHRTPTEIYWVAQLREGKAPSGPKLPREVLSQSTNRNWTVTRALCEMIQTVGRVG